MKKYVKLDIKKRDYILKPIIATVMMAICSLYSYRILLGMISEKMCTIISIIIATVIYVILVFLLGIFSKDNIKMIPYGKKIYGILKTIGIYRETEI